MAELPIVFYPDERLRKIAKPVEKITDETKKIANDMLETMYKNKGIGLAATQVDIHERIIVIDVSEERNQPLVLINPEIISFEGETGIEEGCLSIPEINALVPRHEKVYVKALDLNGNPIEFHADGLFAICLQHEIDHINGKLFIDYLSPFKQKRIRQKVEKYFRNQQKSQKQGN